MTGERIALVAVCLVLAACGGPKSPTSSTSPTPSPSAGAPPPAGAPQTTVRIVDAIGGGPMAGVTATITTRTMAASDGEGHAALWADQAGQYTVTFSGPSATTRTTSLRVPAAETSVSLVPAGFDMTAYDQMFRPSQILQRWTSAPPLVVLTRVVQYEGPAANDPVVLDEEVPEAERRALIDNLSEGFVTLTAGQLGPFSSVILESPDAGKRVNVMRTGVVLVALSRGLTAGSDYWGYGRWARTSSGAVVGGNVMIDADFDGSSSVYATYQRCLRIHELGHALGYNHVTARTSVMNSSARVEPNVWDQQAVHIAFQRPPGNTAPDNDPASFSVNLRTGAISWSPPIY